MFAFFGNVNEKGVYTETRGNVAPLVKAVTPENEKQLAEFDTKIAALSKQLAEHNADIDSHRQSWLDALAKSRPQNEPVEAARIDLQKDAGTSAHVAVTNSVVAADEKSALPAWKADLFGQTAVFDGKQHIDYAGLDFPTADKPFSWSVWVKPTGAGAILSRMDTSRRSRGYDLFLFADRKVGMHVINDWPSNAMKVLTSRPLAAGEWSHVIGTYDGSGKAAGITLYVNGEKQNVEVEADKLNGSTATDQPFRIGMRSADSPLHAEVADVALFQHTLNPQEAQALFHASVRRDLASVKLDTLAKEFCAQLDKLLMAVSTDEFATKGREIQHSLQTVQDERAKYDAAIPMAMVLEERKEPRATYVLRRGRYDQPDKDQQVQPDVPAVLPPLPADAPRNRLGLALAYKPRESADGASRRQPTMATTLWHRLGKNLRQSRGSIRTPISSGATRLVGDGANSIRLGFAAHSATDRDEQHLPAAGRSIARAVRPRSRQPALGTRTAVSPPSRSIARQCALHKRLIGEQNRRPFRDALSTSRFVGRTRRRCPRRLHARPRRRSVSPQLVYLPQAHRATPINGDIRRAKLGDLPGKTGANEYAASSTGAAERCHLYRGGPQICGAHADRGWQID